VEDGRSRVTVVGARRRVDVALPSASPIGEYTPALVELCGQADDAAGPVVWSLALAAAPTFPPHVSLAEAGVADGQVLYLCDLTQPLDTGPVVRDLQPPAGQSRPGTRSGLAAIGAGLAWTVAAAAVAGTASAFAPVGTASALAAAAAVLLLAARFGGAPGRRVPWPVRLAAALASVPCLAVAAAVLARDVAIAGPAWLGAVVGAALGAVLAAAVTPDAVAIAVELLGLVAVAVVALLLLVGGDLPESAAVVALGALGVLALPPWVAANVGTLAVRLRGRPRPAGRDADEAARQIRRADATLAFGASLALAVVLPLLGRSGEPYAVTLAASAGLALLVKLVDAGAPPRGAFVGSAVLVAAFGVLVPTAQRVPGAWWAPAVLAVPGLVLVGTGVAMWDAPRRLPARRWRRPLNAVTAVCSALALVSGVGVLGFLG
jgi:WXG100 protein secretion system (Wss), protein YukD